MIRKIAGACLSAAGLVFVAGCQGAPSINLLGSFFPGWMLCMALGVAGTMAGQLVFNKTGLEPYLKPRPVIYFSLWVLITVGAWLLFFRS